MMRPFHGLLRSLCLALLLSLSCLGLVMSPVAANNSGPAKLCQKGGYVSAYVKSDGSPFTSTGDCVSYGRTGGELVPVSLTLRVLVEPDLAELNGSGLMPGQSLNIVGVLTTGDLASFAGGFAVDETGTRFAQAGPLCGRGFVALTTARDSDFSLEVLDAYGNPISATVAVNC